MVNSPEDTHSEFETATEPQELPSIKLVPSRPEIRVTLGEVSLLLIDRVALLHPTPCLHGIRYFLYVCGLTFQFVAFLLKGVGNG